MSTLQIEIAGVDASQSRSLLLKEGVVTRIGRDPVSGFGIPWDPWISREHADLYWNGGELRITCLAEARNALVCRGENVREAFLRPDDRFSIGRTTFQLIATDTQHTLSAPDTLEVDRVDSRLRKDTEQIYTADALRAVAFRNTEQQMELLAQLPGIMSRAHSDAELGQTLCGLLLQAIPQAEAVAVAHYDIAELPADSSSTENFPRPFTMRVESRDGQLAGFRPSRRIVGKTLREQSSVLHVWRTEAPTAKFTITEGLGWAVCAPIPDESSEGWCLYVSGRGQRDGGVFVSEADLAADLRFTELVAQFIGSFRQVRALQEQQTRLRSFFSPKVIDSLAITNSPDALAPAERDITVMFCDVRGFSGKAERLQEDLLTLLDSVNAALNVMVEGILERDGAISDFQGDAALGFWGWPVALQYGPISACRAAIAISLQFRRDAGLTHGQLEGFTVGIGIAYGRAIAGQIGTTRQSKIGVFGPVVNLGARLESMTKKFRVSICIDGATAEFVDRYLPPAEGRLRRLARVRPQGMAQALDVFQLVPCAEDSGDLSPAQITDYESALDAATAGRWDEALELLERMPEEDGPSQFLRRHMAKFGNSPPADWDGVLSLISK